MELEEEPITLLSGLSITDPLERLKKQRPLRHKSNKRLLLVHLNRIRTRNMVIHTRIRDPFKEPLSQLQDMLDTQVIRLMVANRGHLNKEKINTFNCIKGERRQISYTRFHQSTTTFSIFDLVDNVVYVRVNLKVSCLTHMYYNHFMR